MVEEFRQSGALFAGNFRSLDAVSLATWRDLTQSDIHSYPSIPQIIRYNLPMINYDKLMNIRITSTEPDASVVSIQAMLAAGKRKATASPGESEKKRKKISLKVVINSHVNYRKPLSHLLESILQSDSCRVANMLENIIVCLAQSDGPCGPQLTPLADIADVPAQFARQEVVVIRAAMNSFDWTAHHMLWMHRDSPLVESDYYLYVLDTSVLEKDFWIKTNDLLPSKGEDPFRECIRITPMPHSSISIFGKGVVRNYGENFGTVHIIVLLISSHCPFQQILLIDF